MTDVMNLKETSTRQLRLKLASLARRVDELEEATRSLHRMEDEIMDLQDKVIQGEGSNSSLLSEVDVLRKRVLAIEGKDEEVRKAEDMCRNLKEKLEAEVRLSKDLKEEIEKLQDRMAELEKLEEAFNRSKSDCTQLGLSLNEEKNLTRKLTSELELLRGRVKELESSENRLDKTEKSIIEELEKLKSLTVILAEERKSMNETLQENEQLIQDLTMKLEMNNRLNTVDHSKNSSNLRTNVNEKTYGYTGDRGDLRIEEKITSGLSSKGTLGRGGLDALTISHNVELRNKETQGGQEDNKVKDLTQEIERLKKRLTFLEMVEEDLKKTEAKHNELQEKYLNEQSLAKLLGSQIEEMKQQMSREKALRNGETQQQEVRVRSRQDKPKYRGITAEPQVPKEKPQEVSSQPRSQREKPRNRDLLLENSSTVKSYRRPLSPSTGRRFQRSSSNPRVTAPSEKKAEEKASAPCSEQKDQELHSEKVRKMREPPSVLSRYPPAANESNGKRPWGAQSKQSINGPKSKLDRDDGELEHSTLIDRQKKTLNYSEVAENEKPTCQNDVNGSGEELISTSAPPALQSGMMASYRNLSASPSSYSEAKNSFMVEFEVPLGTDHESAPAKPAEKPPSDPGAVSGGSPATARPRRSKYLLSSRSQDLGLEYTAVKCCPEEDPLRYKRAEAVTAEDAAVSQRAGPELKRVCSPREGLRSKAIIKPAIIAIDKKEVMSTGGEAGAGEQRLSPKAAPNKVTSSIVILPSELSSQRGSGAAAPKEKHTCTSNITIGSSDASVQRSNINIPYEISICRRDIVMKPTESDSSEEDETESVSGLSVGSEVTVRSSEAADDDGGCNSNSIASYRSRRSRLETRNADPAERGAWRSSRAELLSEPARPEGELGLDYSRLATRRASRQGEAASEGQAARPSNGSHASDPAEPRRAATDPGRSYVSVAEVGTRRKQSTSVASKVADWNNSCSQSVQDSSDLLSALNSSVMSKRKEAAKQILSDIVTERVPRTEAVGKRQSVKLELRRNAESSPTHQGGARTEERTTVGILSQIRMTSRR